MQVAPQKCDALATLLVLVQHRWNIPIIDVLHRRGGAKFVTLANELELSRSALSSSLRYLRQHELVQRNPGYGHPLRPEYLLTSGGVALGAGCQALARLVARRDEAWVAYRKWSLPTIAVLSDRPLRFNELRAALGGPTARAVALNLDTLQQQQWIGRRPSAPDHYRLRPRARPLVPIIAELAV